MAAREAIGSVTVRSRETRLRWVVWVAGCLAAANPGCICARQSAPPAPVRDRSNGELPSLRARHVAAGAIAIDGRMNEPAWQQTGSTDALVGPSDGRPVRSSRVNAAARLTWDDANLYVGAVVNDADPTSPFGENDVDPHLWERSSAIELMIQPGDPGDNREYFEIQVDVNRAIWDTRFDDYNRPITGGGSDRRFGHQEWVSGTRRAVVVDRAAGRYTMELAIPWASLSTPRAASPPRAGDTWRVNVYSFRDGQSDSLAWSPTLGQGNFHFAPRFGRVTFSAE